MIRGDTSASRLWRIGEIDRKEFGLTWSQALESGGVVVSNRVKIEIDILAVDVAARAAA